MIDNDSNAPVILYHIDNSASLNEGQTLCASWRHPTKPGLLLSHYGSWILSVKNPNSRIFQSYEKSRLYHTYNTEFIAEKVRKEHFPSLPSRLCCLFAAQSIVDSLRWNQRLGQNGPIRICEIEYSGTLFEFDARLLDGLTLNTECLLSDDSAFTQYEIEAEKQIIDYWRGKKTADPRNEVLIPFPVTISRCYMLNS